MPAHSLDDETALEFCDCTDDDHNGPTQWAAGVDLLSEADELDVESAQLVQDFQEVFH
jgi:hypothetical protein